MEKFYLKSENVEVNLGDKLYHPSTEKTPFGWVIKSEEVTLDEKLLAKLLKDGVIYKREVAGDKVEMAGPTMPEVPSELQYYLEKIAQKNGWHVGKVCNILNTVAELNPIAAMNIVLREIAIEIDKKYKDHIQNSPKIFIISSLNGKIGEVNKAHIANYRNIAAFRSIEDAKIACKIVSPILRGIFKNGKSK